MSQDTAPVVDDLAPAEADPGSETSPHESKLVPVTESIRYRRRAQAAEQQLAALREQFDGVQQQLDDARHQIEQAERRRRIDQLLVEADAIDLDAARLLTEAAVEQMDDADVEAAVRDLRRGKPYLFRRSVAGSIGGGMSPKPRRSGRDVDDAAEAAANTGDRRDLLRYLRMRRRNRAT